MDIITWGETMVCFTPLHGDRLEQAPYLAKTIGGAETNTAIGLARLGKKAGWISGLGDDPFGHFIQKVVRGEGVDIEMVKFSNDLPTGVMFKDMASRESVHVHYYRKPSAAASIVLTEEHFTYLKKAKRVHLTGILPALNVCMQRECLRLIKWCAREGIPVSFDVNLRQKLWDVKEAKSFFEEIYAYLDILFLGDTEACLCSGEENLEEAVSYFRKRLKTSGVLIVKKGEFGASAYQGERSLHSDSVPGTMVVDTVGAGDGFNAGFLYGVLEGYSLEDCLEMGNWCGAMIVSRLGDYQGAPTLEEMRTWKSKRKIVER
ncbi:MULTISPECIES: sugar kinase [unclassified Sutcliffiella]|jgi:2-dehydro-3-deoxygluconokinase|uniref:sugar kinase n=1 Tax=unclassified Sutcliffiella TaxID=2837532 RepID=UPI0030CBF645